MGGVYFTGVYFSIGVPSVYFICFPAFLVLYFVAVFVDVLMTVSSPDPHCPCIAEIALSHSRFTASKYLWLSVLR